MSFVLFICSTTQTGMHNFKIVNIIKTLYYPTDAQIYHS